MTLNSENAYPIIQFRKYVLTQIFEIVIVPENHDKSPCKVSFIEAVTPFPQG